MKLKPADYPVPYISQTQIYGTNTGAFHVGHCYATAMESLYNDITSFDRGTIKFWFKHRLQTKYISLDQANWFLKNILQASIPKRAIEAVKFKPLTDWGVPSYPLSTGEIPWLKVVFDPNQIETEDAFAILAFLRTATTFPSIVTYAKYVYDEYKGKISPIEAFVISSSQAKCDVDTCVFSAHGVTAKGWEKKVKGFTYADSWEKMSRNNYLWIKSRLRKSVDSQINPAFQPLSVTYEEEIARKSPRHLALVRIGSITMSKVVHVPTLQEVTNAILGTT